MLYQDKVDDIKYSLHSQLIVQDVSEVVVKPTWLLPDTSLTVAFVVRLFLLRYSNDVF